MTTETETPVAHPIAGPDGHAYLAIGNGVRQWCTTYAEADALAPCVVQRCLRRGARYGSDWTVKGGL
jgi:hypothetical protein